MKLLNQLTITNKLNILHTFKLIVALIIGAIVLKIYHEPHDVWIIITIVIIMTAHQSLAIQINKASTRIIGTIAGAGLAIVVILLQPPFWLNLIILAIVTAAFSAVYYKKIISDYAFILGLITYGMVALNPQATWLLGVERAVEIIVGIIIALLVSAILFPIDSKIFLQLSIEKNWQLLAKLADGVILQRKNRFSSPEIIQLEQQILKQQQEVNSLLNVKTFHKAKLSDNHFRLQNRYQLAIYRYLIQLEVILLEPSGCAVFNDKLLLLKAVIDNLSSPLFESLADDYAQQIVSLKLDTPSATSSKDIEQQAILLFVLKRLNVLFQRILSDTLKH
jgi:uncharacterized membrane protein YccC